MRVAFRPFEHVRKRADFEETYEKGSKISGRMMTMFTRANTVGVARLGIAATRKLGPAVVRNRAKRLVRELFRHHKPVGSVDVVVVARREMLDAPYTRLEVEFRHLLDRHRSRPTGSAVHRRPISAGDNPRV